MLAEIFGGSNKVMKCECSEIIQLTKLQSYANNDLFVNVVSRIKSFNPELWLEEGGYEEPVVAPTYDIYTKNASYLAALQHIGITQNNTKNITEFETALCNTDKFH